MAGDEAARPEERPVVSEQTENVPGDVGPRLSRVETAIQDIKAMLTGAHKDAAATTAERLDDKPANSVAEEVQRELERRDTETKRREEQERLGNVEAAVKGLTEKPPAPPVRWIESKMGWRG
jgi:hypothetical protein